MKPIAAEWVAKAEGDFAILERECRARKNPSYDGACFHATEHRVLSGKCIAFSENAFASAP